MKIPSNSPASQAKVYAQFRAAMEEAALARARREVAESHVGSQMSLKVTSATEASQEVSGLVVHETRETPVSPGSVAVLDNESGKLIYQAPRPLGLV